ncbi:MAG: DEAD/DEAH box helicase family protein, partial [Pirellulaceae bacterium]
AYRKQIRDEAGQRGESFEMLHDSSLRTLTRLRDIGVGLIILDECHHLLGHWGRVLADAREYLNDPVILGLTATPPDGSGASPADFQRYAEMLGEIDHDVPVPAVVRDGFLAPYQDLVYFVRPTAEELRYVAQADQHLAQVLELACAPREHSAEMAAVEDAAAAELEEPEQDESEEESAEFEEDPLSALHVMSSSEAVFDESTGAPAALPGEEMEFDDLEPVVHGLEREESNRTAALAEWLFTALQERRHAAVRLKSWGALVKRDPEFCQAARAFLQMRAIPLPENVPPLELDQEWSEVPEISIVVPVLDRYVRHALRRSPNPADHELAKQIIAGLRMLGVQITETGCQACASPVGRVLAYSQAKVSALLPILTAEMEAMGDRLRAVVVTDFEKTSATLAGIEHLLNEEAGGAIAAFRALVRNEKTDDLNPILVTGSSVLVDDDLAETFDQAAEAWLAEGGYDAKLTYAEEEGFHVVSGSGKDWCPRVYVQMITELFQRGLTRCLVGTRGLLGEGWDANKINVLIDLTTVTTSMSVRQLRGRSFRLDPAWPEKVANNWDVICLAPEFSKGLDDYARFIRKHENIFGVTDDAVIEKGVGHVHAALTQRKPELLDGSTAELNQEMLARAAQRDQVRALWKIGKPYDGEPVHTFEARLERRDSERAGFPPFSGQRETWSSESLSQSIGTAILYALEDAKLLPAGRRLKTSTRDGGYVRLFLEEASGEESQRFVQALQEALGPLHRPRYVIPRKAKFAQGNWFTRRLPEFLKTYFEP